MSQNIKKSTSLKVPKITLQISSSSSSQNHTGIKRSSFVSLLKKLKRDRMMLDGEID